jgi:putative flippase GtrA
VKFGSLYKKYREIFWYLVFGVLTTLVNIGAYWLFAHPLGLGTLASNVFAWLLSVLFAFFTNKLIVFESRGNGFGRFMWEILTFFGARALTGLLDTAIMVVFVDMLHLNDIAVKIASNIIVIILNYIVSKFVIFAKKKRGSGDD